MTDRLTLDDLTIEPPHSNAEATRMASEARASRIENEITRLHLEIALLSAQALEAAAKGDFPAAVEAWIEEAGRVMLIEDLRRGLGEGGAGQEVEG